MIHKIDERTRSCCYINGLRSLAHDSAAMALESLSRQTLGEDVCLLIFACDLTQLHFVLYIYRLPAIAEISVPAAMTHIDRMQLNFDVDANVSS